MDHKIHVQIFYQMLRYCCLSLRARMLGFETLASRVGATLAPLLMILQAYASTLPWITYGAFPITAGLAVLFLPETKGLPLLDTIQDLQNM